MTSLYMMAMDQRLWLKQAAYGTTDITPEQEAELIELKGVMTDGAIRAVTEGSVDASTAAVLIDDELGGSNPRRINEAGIQVSLALEKSKPVVYEEEERSLNGAVFDEHPINIPKVLVRYNPAVADDLAARQLQNLKTTADRVRARGLPFLVEIIVPPTREQRAESGSAADFDRDLLPDLTLTAIDHIKATGADVDYWKLEAMPDVARFRALLERCREGVDHPVEAVVLGKNAPQETLVGWLQNAADAGFIGFAIGRSIWWDAAQELRAGRIERDEATGRIARNYAAYCQVMAQAQRTVVG
jgi:myo-inositol catabolism protein IolC